MRPLALILLLFEEFYEEFAAKSALLTSRPSNKPWGLREFTMRTSDGHRITCGEPIARR